MTAISFLPHVRNVHNERYTVLKHQIEQTRLGIYNAGHLFPTTSVIEFNWCSNIIEACHEDVPLGQMLQDQRQRTEPHSTLQYDTVQYNTVHTYGTQSEKTYLLTCAPNGVSSKFAP